MTVYLEEKCEYVRTGRISKRKKVQSGEESGFQWEDGANCWSWLLKSCQVSHVVVLRQQNVKHQALELYKKT